MRTFAVPVDAIVLAGGRATRMGGVDKPAIVVGGRRMLDTALAAVAGCRHVTVVGPHRPDLPARIVQVREVPAGSGPVAAIAAGVHGLPDTPDALVVVLASDLPTVTRRVVVELVDVLVAHPDADAVFAVDGADRTQYLLGVWRRAALAARLAVLGDPADLPVKTLVPESVVTVPVLDVADCDTPDDVDRARAAHVPEPMDADTARDTIRLSVKPLPTQDLASADALGATLAAPLVAADALPRVDTSAMDGYAVSGPGPWRLHPEVRRAGSSSNVRLTEGDAVRIATGAHVPPGATAVVRDEFVKATTSSETPILYRRADAPVRDDTRRRGEDWQPGHHLAESGTTVSPAVVSAAASGEVATITVRGPVRAHVAVTGDEIRRGGRLEDGQTRDSLGPILPEVLRHCGVRTVADTHTSDTADGFDALLRNTHDADVIVVVGATGGGAADQLRAALARAGARIVVGRVRCRPGGSQVTAALPDGRVVLGLPGNPVAAVSTLLMMLPVVVDALTARAPTVPIVGAVVNASEAAAPVTRIVPVARRADGTWHADTVVRTAHLVGLIGRDALAVVPPGAVDGQVVELLPLPH
ncbi:NTP transferase domain-containing protein [Prescottella subtropica]|uniref:NTP transferase domain-containing protein n=1 Tax=Prescottella subtropica TaxID=2545757 RepID=UPI0010FA604C|nr:NTP transferase domain-containing protein [Prescottella subtropica]